MNDAVIVATARTPIARAHKGALVDVDAFALAEVAVGGLVERAGVPSDDIDDLILGECLQGGGNIARHTAVRLGMTHLPGLAVNRHCASGLSAVQAAVASVRVGAARAIIAGGSESLSTMPTFSRRATEGAWVPPTHPATREAPNWDMSITVGENAARLGQVSRADADEWALRSHANALSSIDAGWFADEIVPVAVPGPGAPRIFDTDEGPRRDTSLERLAGLPLLHPELEGATVTAGNAGGVNDAAAVVLITSTDYAEAHGLRPLARVCGWSSVGVDPAETGLAPSSAIPKALAMAGMGLGDVDLFEINEAFASVPIANIRRLGIDAEKVNVNGSGCSLGHPVAATGARMVITMLGELRRRGGGVGCVSACAGGGMGTATILEVFG